jgi:iron complex outermembrane receptor protein
MLRRSGTRAAAMVAAWLLAAVPHARADDADLLQPELMLFDEASVSAALKYARPARETPSAVTIITKEEIRRFGYRTLADALRSVRGFFSSYDRNYAFVGIRGSVRPGDYSNRFVLLVNGHTYGDDVYQQSYVGTDFGIDMEAIERIEVVRGAGSALYGGYALFGVVNVVTKDGRTEPGGHALAEVGSYQHVRGQLRYGHTNAAGLDVYAAGSVLNVAGAPSLFYPAYDSPRTNDGVAHDDDDGRALNAFVSAAYRGVRFQAAANRREKGIPTGSYGTTFDDGDNETVDRRRFAELSYEPPPRHGIHLYGRLYYDSSHYHGTYVYGRTKNQDDAQSDWVGSEMRARWELLARNNLTVGTEYSYHPSVQQENHDDPSGFTYLDDDQTYGNVGVYVQDELILLDTLSVVAGARWDRYYERLAEVSPRAAVIWNPSLRTSVKLLYGKGVRPPNAYELYYRYPVGSDRYRANPDLESEDVSTYEIVLERTLWRDIVGAMSLYRYDTAHLIDQVVVNDPASDGYAVFQFQNTGSARTRGIEFEVRSDLPYDAMLRTTYSLQDAWTSGVEHLANSPQHLGTANLMFPLPFEVEGGVELLVVGPRYTLDDHKTHTAYVLNLTLNYDTPIEGLALASSVYNVLDQHYGDPGGPEHRQDQIPQDGVTFRVQLQYAF